MTSVSEATERTILIYFLKSLRFSPDKNFGFGLRSRTVASSPGTLSVSVSECVGVSVWSGRVSVSVSVRVRVRVSE